MEWHDGLCPIDDDDDDFHSSTARWSIVTVVAMWLTGIMARMSDL